MTYSTWVLKHSDGIDEIDLELIAAEVSRVAAFHMMTMGEVEVTPLGRPCTRQTRAKPLEAFRSSPESEDGMHRFHRLRNTFRLQE